MAGRRQLAWCIVPLVLAGCSGGDPRVRAPAPTGYNGGDAQVSRAADSVMVTIPEGHFYAGSTPEQRAQAYADYFASAGHDAAARGKWFDREEDRERAFLPAFRIDLTPVTNAAYAEFVRDTGAPAPFVDAARWRAQGFSQHYEDEVVRLNWVDGAPPRGREDHPVVLVTWDQAAAYCRWRGAVVGEARRLPSKLEFEKAARGERGLVYPWGNAWDRTKLNTQDGGPDDTMPVGSFVDGASPYGVLDAAGNVFHWTSTPWTRGGGADRFTVKGSAWDDYAGVGRGAAQHGRLRSILHAIVGFRCAAADG